MPQATYNARKPDIEKVILLVIDGLDTINLTLGQASAMTGLHGRTAADLLFALILRGIS